MPSAAPTRIRHYDWARALGALAIVMLHVVVACQRSDALAAAHPEALRVEGLVAIPLTRWAVPAFFMMSGALMLDPARQMGWRKVGRHVWRVAFVLLTWGLAFSLVEAAVDAGGMSWAVVAQALVNTLAGRSWDHLWFLYDLVVLYAVTPVLRPWVAGSSRRELGGAVAVLWACLCLAPTVALLGGPDLLGWVRLPFALVYYLAGAYARRWLRLGWKVALAGLASLACMVALAASGVARGGEACLPEYVFALPYGALVLCLLGRWLGERDIQDLPAMALLADCSFGIYVIHPLIGHLMVWFANPTAWPLWLFQLAMLAAGLVGSVALTLLCRRLPGFRGKL